MKRLHIVSDRNPCNGMFVAASLMTAHEDGSRVVTCAEFLTTDCTDFTDYDEIVVHGCWLPCYWKCCWKVLHSTSSTLLYGNSSSQSHHSTTTTSNYNYPRLARMTHANLDPVRLAYHGWKKRLVAPIERWLFRRCDKILVTCEAEREWVLNYVWPCRNVECVDFTMPLHLPPTPKIEIIDLKQFFNFKKAESHYCIPTPNTYNTPLHVLYLGRPHPLKGVQFLKRAVEELNASSARKNTQASQTEQFSLLIKSENKIELRCESNLHGKELEAAWDWCDVFCLPTLSDNFGLVVAEAIERRKYVITTDGAPAWGDFKPRNNSDPHGFVYLRGYREGTDEQRVSLLKYALQDAWHSASMPVLRSSISNTSPRSGDS